MQSNISPTYYYSDEAFKTEKDNIFRNNWHFIGFKFQLENNNDFVTTTIGDTPVVVQNLKGSIKAFLNVCSHRFSIIQCEANGNRPLLCPYHGWSYNAEGIPAGIPKKPLFKKFTTNELCELKLKEFKVEFCGNLCFVLVNDNGVTLADYLGTYYSNIEKISMSFNRQVDVNSMIINANWKIIVENTLESYHVNLIHANTFAKLGTSGYSFTFENSHSTWETTVNLNPAEGAYKKIADMYSSRNYQIPGYKHVILFPNILISSTHGISFNLSVIEPVSPGTSKFTSYVFCTNPNEESKKVLVNAFENSLIDFNRQVFAEDKEICQQVQKGVVHTHQQGMLSEEEKRVHHFQKEYIKLINHES